MLGLDPFTATSLLILAAAPQNFCAMPAPTAINVIPTTRDVKYDYSQGVEQLQNVAIDTVDPHGFEGISTTQGYMKGSIKMEPRVKLNFKHYPKQDAVCLWYETVDIKIEIDPTIVIAKEVAQDSCMKAAVLAHEMKHVEVDRQIVNKYAKLMGQKVYAGLQERGFKSAPLRSEDAQGMADRMQKTVFQIVEHEYKKMELERMDLQRAVDNKEEYERVSAQCPNFSRDVSFAKKGR